MTATATIEHRMISDAWTMPRGHVEAEFELTGDVAGTFRIAVTDDDHAYIECDHALVKGRNGKPLNVRIHVYHVDGEWVTGADGDKLGKREAMGPRIEKPWSECPDFMRNQAAKTHAARVVEAVKLLANGVLTEGVTEQAGHNDRLRQARTLDREIEEARTKLRDLMGQRAKLTREGIPADLD